MPTDQQRLDKLLLKAYGSSTAARRGRRRLRVIALRLRYKANVNFLPSILWDTWGDSVARGLVLGTSLGLAFAAILLLAGLAYSLIFGSLPDLGAIQPTAFVDPALAPVYWAVSWLLLRWHSVLGALLRVNEPTSTDLDWVLSIVMLVISVRVVMFPLYARQIRSQRAMRDIQPKVNELRQRHKDDRETLRVEMMRLYQTEKINPLMGCLSFLIQVPIFFAIYHVLQRLNPDVAEIEAARYGWSSAEFHDAARARFMGVPIVDNYEASGTVKALFVVGLLATAWMTLSYVTSYQMISKQGYSFDPQQRMIQRLVLYGIPISIVLSVFAVPVGLIVYALAQSGFTLVQQQWMLHRYRSGPRGPSGGSSAAFGLTFVFVFGAAAMLAVPLGTRFGRDWPSALLVATLAAAAVGFLVGLREWVATWPGGLGPLRAGRFVRDAAKRGILVYGGLWYSFKEPWIKAQLANKRGRRGRPTPSHRRRTASPRRTPSNVEPLGGWCRSLGGRAGRQAGAACYRFQARFGVVVSPRPI